METQKLEERGAEVFGSYLALGEIIKKIDKLMLEGLKNEKLKKDYVQLFYELESAYYTLHYLVKEEAGLDLNY